MKFELTQEGKKYLEKGLPEANLVKILKKPMPIDIAKKKIENFDIAIKWGKKSGWLKIDSGKLILLIKPKEFPLYNSLLKIKQGKQIGPHDIDLLLKRKLIKKQSEAKKFEGKEVSELTPELIKSGLWRKVKLKPYNVEVIGKKKWAGKRQPYNQFLNEVKRKLVELGFKETRGPIIELEFWNFDALFQAQNHPSRDWAQTYVLKNPKYGNLPDKKIVEKVKATHENGWKTGSSGWGYKWNPKKAAQLMPVAHDTALSPKILSSKELKIPGKYFQIMRCYRPDVIDATHGVEFNQLGGFVIGKEMNFQNLLGLLKMFATEIACAEKVKFLPDYYPFTEPSVQLSAKHVEMGWIEFAGAGIFRPELTLPLGVKEPVIAWGLGIDRLAMFKLGIKDIRNLFSQDLNWLRRQPVVK